MDINKKYKNGQKVAEQTGDERIIYYENGNIRAKGEFTNDKMQGKWIFHRKSGALWAEGELKDDIKDGVWKRWDKEGKLEYHAIFKSGKLTEKILRQ